MTHGKYRVLLVSEHPVQYTSVLWAMRARHPKLDILVAYCSLRGVVRSLNPGFGVELEWDIPLLDGYPWVLLPPAKIGESVERRARLFSKGTWQLIGRGKFDAIYLGGYYFPEAWTALLAAKIRGIPLVLSTDVHELRSRRARSGLMQAIKRIIVSRIFRMAGAVNAGSSGATAYLKSLGVPKDRILLGVNAVDNDWWTSRAAQVNRAEIRRTWDIPIEAPVVLYCGNLRPWKRPADLLAAFSQADVPGSYLVFAGDGPLRATLEAQAASLGVVERVRFLGFVNQTELPAVYASSDLLVLPSNNETFGLVVNEAMLCGCPAAVSDRVGAKYDLIRDDLTGFTFACGDKDALTRILRKLFNDPAKLKQMRAAAIDRMTTWTPQMNTDGFVKAVEYAVEHAGRASVHMPK